MTLIDINSLKVKYKDFLALNIDKPISINRSDKIGVIGLNGSGKTTLVKTLLGLLKYEGNIKYNIKYTDMAVHLQHNNYVETMSVLSIIKNILKKEELNSNRFNELIKYFNFDKCLNKKFQHLSGGEKQRLTIILVLMQNRKLTFFDEVTTGLDFETRKDLIDKINSWYEKENETLIFVTHYYEELEMLVNKLLILHNGKVIDYGSSLDLFNKYCGRSVIIYDNNDKVSKKLENYEHIIAPKNLRAIKIKNKEDEINIIKDLVSENINFKRTNYDIELIYLNAIGDLNG